MGEQKRLVLGIDGGGTKTHSLLVALDGTVVAENSGGPSNLQREGIGKAASTLMEIIVETCKKGDCTSDALQSVVIGVAGAGRDGDRGELLEALASASGKRKFPLKNVVVESDARIALEAAFAGGPGIVVIAGTGSIALYRTEDSKMLRAGGWGYLLGDEGSGYSVARDGVNAVLRQHDGRGDKTSLTGHALLHFGVAAAEALIPKIYLEHADIASFVPKVLEAASVDRDRVANQILLRNAGELLELVRSLTIQVPPKRKLPVCLMGGLLERENVYAKLVRDKINHSLPQVVVQKPKFAAAFGAAIIGLKAFH